MLLFFSKTPQNKQYITNAALYGVETPEDTGDFDPPIISQLSAFFAPNENVPQSCSYPLNVRELFPYWLRIANEGNPLIIGLTEYYYKWLSCNTSDINSLSFFRLEDLVDVENIPEELIEHLVDTYLNSYPKKEIQNGTVSPEKLKNIIDNVKVNLYAKKGASDSFKLLINEFFGVDPDKISVSYPKQYVLRLNSGRFEWMRTSPLEEQNLKQQEYPEFFKNTTGSFLNYSVLYDNDLWQDFSYVVNTPEVTVDQYTNTIRPLVHPAGTKDFFQIRFDLFNNDVQEEVQVTEYETPTIQNYALYTIGSTGTIGYSFGCSGAYGGVTGQPSYLFPYWDEEIATYYIQGMSFGEINTGDFFTLYPGVGFTFLNRGLTCG